MKQIPVWSIFLIIVFSFILLFIAISGLFFVVCAQYKAQAPMWAWDVCYVESAALGTIALNHLVFNKYWKAYLATIGIALLKEFGDEVYQQGYFWKPVLTHWFWDSRGSSIRDIGLAAISVSISFPLRKRGLLCK